jgi:hypothetical protein
MTPLRWLSGQIKPFRVAQKERWALSLIPVMMNIGLCLRRKPLTKDSLTDVEYWTKHFTNILYLTSAYFIVYVLIMFMSISC